MAEVRYWVVTQREGESTSWVRTLGTFQAAYDYAASLSALGVYAVTRVQASIRGAHTQGTVTRAVWRWGDLLEVTECAAKRLGVPSPIPPASAQDEVEEPGG